MDPEVVRYLTRTLLVIYSEWLDTEHLLDQSVRYPVSLTHEELVDAFLSDTGR